MKMRAIAFVLLASSVLSPATARELLAEKAGYLESAGKLYRNTGYCVGPKTRVELDFQLTEVENTIRLFGVGGKFAGTSVNQQFEVYVGQTSQGVLKLSYATINASETKQAANVLDADTERIMGTVPTNMRVAATRHLTRITIPTSALRMKADTGSTPSEKRSSLSQPSSS